MGARQNPTKIFDDSFAAQRQYLNDDTWDIIMDMNPDIKLGSREYNILPERIRAVRFAGSIRNSISNASSYTPEIISNIPGLDNAADVGYIIND